ncbi:hypothetical protein Rsub_03017 [Raphidocelis subcapitata]|uniref:Magnesium transporter n=1 Tax=Raphidocelis subcapitata TaxID=307507 RepID=A0A2V0NSV7_9CHLO|nr:hypothetical protein Rsub_03017 [Raphidocelis subcapitata]|eukprot:GBF90716.1 hypothetical protein Rsub_03017 [Raphidocelis subcapitata]
MAPPADGHAAAPAAPGAAPAAAPLAPAGASGASLLADATDAADADGWFTHELHVPSQAHLLSALLSERDAPLGRGGTASSASRSTAGWSELDLEVERLAQALSQLRCACDVTVVDYCSTRTRFATGLTNSSLGAFMAKERPPWSKVRWVNVTGGISGDVLKVLTEAYDLQPLALEDTTTFQRIKLDAYREHLFLTSYVFDLVDRKKERRAKEGGGDAPAKGKAAGGGDASGRSGRDGGGGGGGEGLRRRAPAGAGDVESGRGGAREPRAGRAGRAGGCAGCGGGGGGRSPCCRRRDRARPYVWGPPGGGGGDGSTTSSASSSGFSSLTSSGDDAGDYPGGPSGGGESGGGRWRPLRRVNARVWRDDDAAQLALDSWQRKLFAQREALSREWQERVGGGGAGAAGGAAGGGDASARHGAGRGGAAAAGTAGGGEGASSHASGRDPAARAVAAHLAAKHRRRARLRTPLCAPFYSFETSGRSLGRRKVMLEQVSFFLCPGGVVLSLFQRCGHAVAAPVLARLRGMQSLLVDSEDPGVLLQLLRGKYEVSQTRRLHLLSTDLSIMLRSYRRGRGAAVFTLQPMLSALEARCILPPPASDGDGDGSGSDGGAASERSGPAASLAGAPAGSAAARGRRSSRPGAAAAGGGAPWAAGSVYGGAGGGGLGRGGLYLSELAGMYVADLHDQAVTGEQDLAALLEHTNRLNELVFNSVSHSNESSNMTLAVLGTFFMPITFLAGVFGMNFDKMPELHWSYGYGYFWVVCGLMLALSFLFLLAYRIVNVPRSLREVHDKLMSCLSCLTCRWCFGCCGCARGCCGGGAARRRGRGGKEGAR